MKTRLFLISLIVFTILSCSEKKDIKSEKKSDLKLMELNGKVKSIRELIYNAIEKNGEYIKQEKATMCRIGPIEKYILFNQKGYIIEEIEHFVNGDINNYNRTTNSYDINDNIIEICHYDIIQNCIYKKVTTYNKQNKVVEEKFYESDKKLKSISKYKYDQNGYAIEKTEYLANGDMDEKIICKNDSKGNPIEILNYDSKGKLNNKENNKYDNNGNNIESITKWPEGGYIKSTSIYDEKNNLIEHEYYYDEILNSSESYLYSDDRLTKIEETKFEKRYNPDYDSYKTTKYDKKGNQIECIIKRIEGDKITIEKEIDDIKYDDNGNKVETNKYFDDKLKIVEKAGYGKNGKVFKDFYRGYGGLGFIPGYPKDDIVYISYYQYDSYDNLINRTYYSSWDGGTFIFEKEIEYYE